MFRKKSIMYRAFPFLCFWVWRVVPPAGGQKRCLHPAAEAREKHDERSEKERHQDGKTPGLARERQASVRVDRKISTGMQQAEARVPERREMLTVSWPMHPAAPKSASSGKAYSRLA